MSQYDNSEKDEGLSSLDRSLAEAHFQICSPIFNNTIRLSSHLGSARSDVRK